MLMLLEVMWNRGMWDGASVKVAGLCRMTHGKP
jgi:hypothetical protein